MNLCGHGWMKHKGCEKLYIGPISMSLYEQHLQVTGTYWPINYNLAMCKTIWHRCT